MLLRILCCALSLMITLIFTGCDSQRKELIGQWEGSTDLSQSLSNELQSELDEKMKNYVNLSKFPLDLLLTIRDDDTYDLHIKDAALAKAMSYLEEDLHYAVADYMTELTEDMGLTMTMEEVLSISGTTMEVLMAQLFSQNDLEQMVTGTIHRLTQSGTYEIEDDTVILTSDERTITFPLGEISKLEEGLLMLPADRILEGQKPIAFRKLP